MMFLSSLYNAMVLITSPHDVIGLFFCVVAGACHASVRMLHSALHEQCVHMYTSGCLLMMRGFGITCGSLHVSHDFCFSALDRGSAA